METDYVEDLGGNKRLITVKSVGNIGWKIIGVSYMDDILTSRKEVNEYLVRVVAAVLVLVIFISMLLAMSIARPIKRMEKTIRVVERGRF